MQSNLALEKIQTDVPEFINHQACIHCSACIPACPSQLNPESLYAHIRNTNFRQAEKDSLDSCSQCGECNKVCPSKIPLAQTFAYGINMLKLRTGKKIFAAQSKQRVQLRKQRLINKKSLQLEFLSTNKQGLADKLHALKNTRLEK